MIIWLVISIALLCLGDVGHARAGAPSYKVKREDIVKLSPPMQRYFAGLQYLLNPFQVRQFLSLDNDKEREQWIARFWRMHDPTPTTPKNEMLTEHTIRVKLARQFYRSKKWPGWDKRGEVFIRYGPPDYRAKVWGEISVNRRMRSPGEIWYFRRHNMLVSFQNFGLKGEYIYSIDPLGAAEKLSPDLAEFLQYDTSSSLSSKIPQNLVEALSEPVYEENPFQTFDRQQEYLMSRERKLADDIDAIMDPDQIEILPKDVSAVFQKEQLRKVADNFETVLHETPASYPFNFDPKEQRFYFGIDQFKGGEKTNRVDVQLEVPVSVESGSGSSFDETFHAEVVIWDAQYNEVARKQKDIRLKIGPEVKKWSNLIPTQMILSLDRGYYRMGISVRGEKSGRSSSFRTSFSCEPFGGRLALSDILFARRITEAGESSSFTRGALEVVPHPVRAYSRSVPMPIYFEVYNLATDDRGLSSYTVEYKIIPHTRRKQRFWKRFQAATPVVSSRFQTSGFGSDEVQHVSINTANLRKGSFDLLVTLRDDLSNAVTFRRGTFSLVD